MYLSLKIVDSLLVWEDQHKGVVQRLVIDPLFRLILDMDTKEALHFLMFRVPLILVS